MIFSSWNVRGAGSIIKIRELSALLSTKKISVMVLVDPKLHHEGIVRFQLKFPMHKILTNVGIDGWASLLMMWDTDSVSLMRHTCLNGSINCLFQLNSTKEFFHVFGVYLSTDFRVRKPQLLELQDHLNQCSAP